MLRVEFVLFMLWILNWFLEVILIDIFFNWFNSDVCEVFILGVKFEYYLRVVEK